MTTISTEYTWEEAEYMGSLWTVEFVLDICATPGRPARTRGPPENCYPEEGATLEVFDVEPVSMRSEKWSPQETASITPKSTMMGYWRRRFEKEVEPSDDFKEWAWERVGDEEARFSEEPDEDDFRREER